MDKFTAHNAQNIDLLHLRKRQPSFKQPPPWKLIEKVTYENFTEMIRLKDSIWVHGWWVYNAGKCLLKIINYIQCTNYDEMWCFYPHNTQLFCKPFTATHQTNVVCTVVLLLRSKNTNIFHHRSTSINHRRFSICQGNICVLCKRICVLH